MDPWEEVERRATRGRGSAGEVVSQVRNEVAAAHVGLVTALADWWSALRQPNRAITYLEDGLRRRPDEAAIAIKLVAAYEQAGQPRLAARLREDFGLDESS